MLQVRGYPDVHSLRTMSSKDESSIPPSSGQGDTDCTSQKGAQQLLCLIANPYASSVSKLQAGKIAKLADNGVSSSKRQLYSPLWAILLVL